MLSFFPWKSSQQKTIINAMAVNEDGVMVTGGNKFISDPFLSCDCFSLILVKWVRHHHFQLKLFYLCVTEGDNGSIWFWDWKSGHSFQQSETIVQPGMYIYSFHGPLLLICL